MVKQHRTISLPPFRWAAFRGLEWLSHFRNPPQEPVVQGPAALPPGKRCVWVYATTIGELNAIEPWLRALFTELGGPHVVLVTNHAHYSAAYMKKFPEATFLCIDGASGIAEQFVGRLPPDLLVVAEIPCLLHDAPCRFSFATLVAARRAGASVVLVNGWLYGDLPGSRMDHIEKQLFNRAYVAGFDLALVQTDEVRQALIAQGAEASRVVTTGNLKYDAMRVIAANRPQTPLSAVLAAYEAGPIVVAGSVSEPDDQVQLMASFKRLCQAQPAARLVIAPRHPENLERMAILADVLRNSGLSHRYRTQSDVGAALDGSVLVLDTIGELSACYAAATWAYVGTDHNVLEPLAYGRLVFTSGDWKSIYPSYPVYVQTKERGLIAHVDRIDGLGQTWVDMLPRRHELESAQRERVALLMAGDEGRVSRSISILKQFPGVLP